MRPHTRQEIERIATETRIASGEDSIPVNVKVVAEHLGARVVEEGFSDDLSGVLLRKGGNCTIAVNFAHSPLRRRFTIAHECGHLVLEHKGEVFIDKHVLNRRDGNSSLAVNEQEIQANQFAASLLMPREEVVRHMDELLRTYRSHGMLVDLMASRFKVSKSAMEIRLVNLGLTSPKDDDN
ncbi:MAG TPA: ImmA/IrrE family metallo-endopeptidase [Ramlibacter sp.]|uniref:ImmA/IrrE family metallo-endopeptidase n=1 Tax=Ramlibacter sp. TaxID=1917967 RepID=UPI002BA32B25|nr:ImmA/IrrE family metallo-endopeptidase [Ramlibacter sp.]HVZ42517.1 ImmA/IrrE family metallo-endopeptidase [Ramlibacter sp.]